ncbi:MAG: FAD binding domain-containing protein [Acidimicrobiia bacterium]|nr:FAD binding domain-containing protein [Acidimicrobiia bacterium]
MRLPPFTLHRPRELGELLELLARYGDDAAVYMGGTELLLIMKLGFAEPGHLVDAKSIPELGELHVSADRLAIGAGVTHRRIERHHDVQRALPVLVDLERRIANVRVRNAGTLGGNLCFAEPHSDPATLLTALDAEVELAGPAGRRRLAVADFILGALSTALDPGEVLTHVHVPVPGPDTLVGYERIVFTERPAATVAVVRGPAGARVVVGALGPRPMRVPHAEMRLVEDDIDAAVEATSSAVADTDTEPGADYRAHLAGVLLRRAWSAATANALSVPGAAAPTKQG